MVSRIITPPDHIKSNQSFLVINAVQEELATLVLWMKTIAEPFDVHLYHSQMSETDWALEVAETAETILVSKPNSARLDPRIAQILESNSRVVYFGNGTEYPDLIHFFLTKNELS